MKPVLTFLVSWLIVSLAGCVLWAIGRGHQKRRDKQVSDEEAARAIQQFMMRGGATRLRVEHHPGNGRKH